MSGLLTFTGLVLAPIGLMAFIIFLVVALTSQEHKRLRKLLMLVLIGFLINFVGLFVFGLVEITLFGKGPFGAIENLLLKSIEYFCAGYLVGIYFFSAKLGKPIIVLIPIAISWIPMFVLINTGNYDQILMGLLINASGGFLGASYGIRQKPA